MRSLVPPADRSASSINDPVDPVEATVRLARVACRQVGLPAERLELVRLHSNGVFRLPWQRVVIRVGSGADAAARAGRAVLVAERLGKRGYPQVENSSCDFLASFWLPEATGDRLGTSLIAESQLLSTSLL